MPFNFSKISETSAPGWVMATFEWIFLMMESTMMCNRGGVAGDGVLLSEERSPPLGGASMLFGATEEVII